MLARVACEPSCPSFTPRISALAWWPTSSRDELYPKLRCAASAEHLRLAPRSPDRANAASGCADRWRFFTYAPECTLRGQPLRRGGAAVIPAGIRTARAPAPDTRRTFTMPIHGRPARLSRLQPTPGRVMEWIVADQGHLPDHDLMIHRRQATVQRADDLTRFSPGGRALRCNSRVPQTLRSASRPPHISGIAHAVWAVRKSVPSSASRRRNAN